jgi:ribosome-binding factor A
MVPIGDERANGYRHQRLEELIVDELRSLFRDDIEDPAFADVDILGVELSADYKNVRVFYWRGNAEEPSLGDRTKRGRAAAREQFARLQPFLRRRLVEAIDMKFAPMLTFVETGKGKRAGTEEP